MASAAAAAGPAAAVQWLQPDLRSLLARHLAQPLCVPELDRNLFNGRYVGSWPLLSQPVCAPSEPLHIDQVVSIAVHLGYCTCIQLSDGIRLRLVLQLRLGKLRARQRAPCGPERLRHRLRRLRALPRDVFSSAPPCSRGSHPRARCSDRRQALPQARPRPSLVHRAACVGPTHRHLRTPSGAVLSTVPPDRPAAATG